ncbi:MAG: hypothetical protein HYU77_16600 [Betaproteobacteria bacterium]|nr:hypothetical protein [Betaproteobacteria bacterium]
MRVSQVSIGHSQAGRLGKIRHTRKNDLQEKASQNVDLASYLKNWAFLVAIYIYFVGWIYLYFYYRQFGIPLVSLDVPFYYFFVYSYAVIGAANTWLGYTFIVLFVVVFVLLQRPWANEQHATLNIMQKAILIVSSIALFYVSFALARDQAQANAMDARDNKGTNSICFTLKKEAEDKYPPDFLGANAECLLMLLTETRERYYVLHQPPSREGVMPYGYAHEVPKDTVILATIRLKDAPITERTEQ